MSNPWFAENLNGFVREEFETLNAKRPDGALYERERDVAAGELIDIPYLSTDYAGSGTLLWPVAPKHITTAAYSLTGMQMTLALYLAAFSVSGAGNILRFKIPGGYKAGRASGAAVGLLNDNGTQTTGQIFVTADDDVVKVTRTDQANFTASTSNSSLVATLTFWVKSQAI